MLHGSIWDKIPRFALPVAATAILEQLFNASDLAVVGNFTGDQRTAAVAAALIFGVLFTALVQSSSSSIAIFQAFAIQGILDLSLIHI